MSTLARGGVASTEAPRAEETSIRARYRIEDIRGWVYRNLFASAVLVLPVLARLPYRQREGGQAHIALAQEFVACLVVALAATSMAWRAPWTSWSDSLGRAESASEHAPHALRGRAAKDPISIVVALLVLLELVSAALASNPWMALRASSVWLAGLTTFAVARVLGNVTIAPVLATALVASSVIAEATGLSVGWSRSGHAPGGFLGERNAASQFLVCSLPVAAAIAMKAKRPSLRALSVTTIAASSMAIVLTRTRSSWLALGLLAALGLSLAIRTSDDEQRKRASQLTLAGAFGIASALTVPIRLVWTSTHPYRETLSRLVDASSSSGEGRLAQYATTWKMALAHPLLGTGPGNWAGQYMAYASPGDPTVRLGYLPTQRVPASDVLGFLAERGFVAALLLAMLVLLLARTEGGHDDERWLRRATCGAAFVVGMFDAVLQLAPHLLLVAWVLGSASAPRSTRRARASGGRDGELRATNLHFPSARRARRILVLLGLGSTIAALFALARAVAFVLIAEGPSFADLERAATLDPGNVALRLSIAHDWIEAGRCDRARGHLTAAEKFATIPATRELRARCE